MFDCSGTCFVVNCQRQPDDWLRQHPGEEVGNMANELIIDGQDTVSVRISVRDLVEFILRSGDLDSRLGRRDVDAMQEGARMHRKIQKRQGSFYRSEVPLSITSIVSHEELTFAIMVEGRADGILTLADAKTALQLDNPALTFADVPAAIDEIKCLLRDVDTLTEPVPVHLAQAKCYAYMYVSENDLPAIAVQMTYCSIDTEKIRYFTEFYTKEELSDWYYKLCQEYCKWAYFEHKHQKLRNISIQSLPFPFPYRPGQKELASGVYRTILREKLLFLEAPTGVGKTISTVYPAIKAMGEGLTSKIFYLTAKTITRTVAEDTFRLLFGHGLRLLPITITAREKVCILDKPDCNPSACERAKGHFDRVNECLYDMLTSLAAADENNDLTDIFTREILLSYAEKHCVCPYELSLDLALFSDAVICDYNYAFDPEVYLRRFFASEKNDYVLLIDEAHNLVERAREMYSAVLVKEQILAAKRAIKDTAGFQTIGNQLEAVNKTMRTLKNRCEKLTEFEEIDLLSLNLLRLLGAIETKMSEAKTGIPEELLDVYFDARHFLAMHDIIDEHFTVYGDYTDEREFFVRLQCMDPSRPLRQCLDKGRSAIFFSATLLPVRYYRDQLGGTSEDYSVYAPSPFAVERRRILIAPDVNTRYSHRNEKEFRKIQQYVRIFVEAQPGNYLVFFPSYQMLSQLQPYLEELGYPLRVQTSKMNETEREQFLSYFETTDAGIQIGLCVMGGIFSEGIDLRADRLIGAVIVSPGLPMFCPERELFKNYFDRNGVSGFDYAYRFPGINKVLQSAGRVIRTAEDKGAILLLDDRFATRAYQELFPKEWFPNELVTLDSLPLVLSHFWSCPASEAEPDNS